MADFPALPFFTDAYLADTRHLTTAEHGAYILLLITAWRMPDCALPHDDAFLGRIVGDPKNWPRWKVAIMPFWQIGDDGKIRQKRLLKEREYVEALRLRNSRAGKASALKRLNTGSTSVQQDLNENPTPTPTPTPKKEKEPYGSKKKVSLDALSVDHIADWLAGKRAVGLYLRHDEHAILEAFKDYCLANDKKYSDYVAAYRNAFAWERLQPGKAPERKKEFDGVSGW